MPKRSTIFSHLSSDPTPHTNRSGANFLSLDKRLIKNPDWLDHLVLPNHGMVDVPNQDEAYRFSSSSTSR